MRSKTIDFKSKALSSAELAPPPAGPNGEVVQLDVYDRSTPGLYLRISSTGVRTWMLADRILIDGRRKLARRKIGRAWSKTNPSGLSLADARNQAYELKAAIDAGKDPRQLARDEERQKVEASLQTFEATVARFLEVYPADKGLRPATVRQYEDFLRGADFAILNDKPVTAISRADINAVLERIRRRGCGVRRNRALASVKKLFRWLIENGDLNVDPTGGMKPPVKEFPRERHLFGDTSKRRPSEIALLWRAAEICGPDDKRDLYAPFLRCLILTGQRLEEVGGMRWNELVNIDGAEPHWIIPASRAKNRTEHRLPLGPMAIAAIKAAPRINGSPFVFSLNGKNSLSGWSKWKKRMDAAIAELKAKEPERYGGQFEEAWVIHDLRRTLATGLVELGVSVEIVDSLQNHISGVRRGVRRHYIHARHEAAKRVAMLLWEKHVAECLDPSAVKSNVISLPAKTATS